MEKQILKILKGCLLSFLVLGFLSAEAGAEQIRIATYQSFIGKSGLGTKIAEIAKARHQIDIKWDASSDGNAMVTRAKLVGKANRWDMVIGFEEARVYDQEFRAVLDGEPVAFDQAPMGLMTKNVAPVSLKELQNSDNAVLIQDPRSSTPGATLMWFVMQTLGEKEGKNFFCQKAKLGPQSILSSWDMAYTLFQKEPLKVKAVWSYSTSLTYHLRNKETGYKFVELVEGAPLQKEFLAITQWSDKKKAAAQVRDIILSPEIQAKVLETNFMLPIIGKDESQDVPKVKKMVELKPEVGRKLGSWMNEFPEWMTSCH